MIMIIILAIIIVIIALVLNSIFNKINIDQKGKSERWIINSISILSVFFFMFFIISGPLSGHSYYDIESFLKGAFYDLKVSFMGALINLIIYQPIFLVLDDLKKKNIYKIILSIILIVIIEFIIFISNFRLTF